MCPNGMEREAKYLELILGERQDHSAKFKFPEHHSHFWWPHKFRLWFRERNLINYFLLST